jgi:transposase
VGPARDTGVALVMTRLDTAAMNLFLAELAQAVTPGTHAVLLMDKAGWHIAGNLVVPTDLTPVFLPPYSPELTRAHPSSPELTRAHPSSPDRAALALPQG